MRALLFVLIVGAASCYSPGFQPCELACSANRECPDGLACNAQNACAMTSSAMCSELPIDAPLEDVASTSITIEVRDRTGGPLAAALVVFADSAGAQIAEMPTGADGKATADVPAGGSATVIRMVQRPNGAPGSDLHASTYLDLWPGAHIISQAEIDQRTRTVTFQLTPPSGTSEYHVYTSCTGFVTATTTLIDVAVPQRCPMFDAFVIAGSPTTMQAMFASVLPAQTGPTVAVSSASFKAWRNLSGTLSGLPANAAGRSFNVTPWATPALPAPTRPLVLAPPDATGNLGTFMFPVGAGLQTQLVVTAQGAVGGPSPAQIVNERAPASTTVFNRDYNATLLPWVGNPVFDTSTRRLTWPFIEPTGTTPATPAFFVASVAYNHDPNMGVIWRVIGDASRISTTPPQHSFTFPDVPGTRTFEPIAADVVSGNETITLVGLEAQAVHEVREILETEGDVGGYFKIPALRHVTVSVGQ